MSYTLYIYPIEVMRTIQAGGDWADVEGVRLEPAEKQQVPSRLEKYGYRQVHEPSEGHEYEKNFGNQPVRVAIFGTMVVFSAPYWDELDDVLFDIRMDVLELADSPELAFHDPQQDDWVGGE